MKEIRVDSGGYLVDGFRVQNHRDPIATWRVSSKRSDMAWERAQTPWPAWWAESIDDVVAYLREHEAAEFVDITKTSNPRSYNHYFARVDSRFTAMYAALYREAKKQGRFALVSPIHCDSSKLLYATGALSLAIDFAWLDEVRERLNLLVCLDFKAHNAREI